MALERNDPIPPGIYWIDVFKMTLPSGENQDRLFNDWLAANRATVKVIRSQHTEGQLARPGVSGPVPDATWVLFQVLKPTIRWKPDTHLGFPTKAPRGTETKVEDVIQAPSVADSGDGVPWGWIALGGLGVALLFGAAEWVRGKIGSEEKDHA